MKKQGKLGPKQKQWEYWLTDEARACLDEQRYAQLNASYQVVEKSRRYIETLCEAGNWTIGEMQEHALLREESERLYRELKTIENRLMDNPASGWLPF